MRNIISHGEIIMHLNLNGADEPVELMLSSATDNVPTTLSIHCKSSIEMTETGFEALVSAGRRMFRQIGEIEAAAENGVLGASTEKTPLQAKEQAA